MIVLILILNPIVAIVILYILNRRSKEMVEKITPQFRNQDDLERLYEQKQRQYLEEIKKWAEAMQNQMNLRFHESLSAAQTNLLNLQQKTDQAVSQAVTNANEKIVSLSQDQINLNTEQIKTLISEKEKEINDLIEQTKQESQNHLREFNDYLAQELKKNEAEIKTLFDGKVVEGEKRLEDYYKIKIAALDSSIEKIIAQIAHETLGKVIDTSTHKEVILESLEKAKKEIFGNA